MQYMLLIHDDPTAWAGMSEEQVNAVMGEYFAYSDAIRKEGVFVAGDALQGPDTAHTLRVRDGNRFVRVHLIQVGKAPPGTKGFSHAHETGVVVPKQREGIKQ